MCSGKIIYKIHICRREVKNRCLNAGLGLYEKDMEFAVKLFEQPMTERFTWLQDKTYECIIHNNKVSMEEAESIMNYVAALGGWMG